jgi:NADPH:quinone reductase-like Zn-dependent oxidoreductase
MPGKNLRGLELRSLISSDGALRLWLEEVETSPPEAGEIVVRIEAAPVNSSDLGALWGATSPTVMRGKLENGLPVIRGQIPAAAMEALGARLGQVLPAGNEGAGTVVVASPDCEHLLGRTVGVAGGATYAQFRKLAATQCQLMPEGTTAQQAASWFVNPMTALAMVETMRREGHVAIVDTAAASQLGQILNRICRADGVPLVNIVRSAEQAAILRAEGARYVVDSSAPDFENALADAVAATKATIAFDAVGGGGLASTILVAMERAINRGSTEYSRYGSLVHKQIYIYGSLDDAPTIIERSVGTQWSVGGFLVRRFLALVGTAEQTRLMQRVADEIDTTFATHFNRVVSLPGLLDPDVLAEAQKRSTGGKIMVAPGLDETARPISA